MPSKQSQEKLQKRVDELTAQVSALRNALAEANAASAANSSRANLAERQLGNLTKQLADIRGYALLITDRLG